MKLTPFGDVILVEPDDPTEFRADEPDHDDAEAREESRAVGWRIVDQHGNVMGGNQ